MSSVKYALIATGFVFATSLGILAPSYHITLLTFMMLYGILALSYDIMGGLIGYMNLGHIIFYGIGAYVFGLTINYLHKATDSTYSPAIILFLAFVMSMITTGLVALLLSYPLFRLRGFYFAVASLGLISFTNLLFSSPELAPITGGFSGITLIRDIARLTSPQLSYYLALGFFIITSIVHFLLRRGRIGLNLKCINEDEELSEISGINTFRYKQLALILSAMLAGIAGGCYMWFQTYINPRLVFSIELAFLPLTIALLGGSGTFIGPLVGAIIFTIVYQFLVVNLPSLTKLIFGVVLIGVGIGGSRGLMEIYSLILRRFRRQDNTS
jgi:branched-chain amino acid transport system permease protein